MLKQIEPHPGTLADRLDHLDHDERVIAFRRVLSRTVLVLSAAWTALMVAIGVWLGTQTGNAADAVGAVVMPVIAGIATVVMIVRSGWARR